MTGRATMLPVAMVVVILFLAMAAILTGRSNAPDVAADSEYPHHVCTFNDYCNGADCSRDPTSFIAYLTHSDGEPRLEISRPGVEAVDPRATLVRTGTDLVFETTAGPVRGTLTIFSNRTFDWVGFSGDLNAPVEHYGSGKCERLKTP